MTENDFSSIIANFLDVAALADFQLNNADLKIEVLPAPHKPKSLPKGKMALYGFYYKNTWLKIGIAGPKSNARFHSQHYSPKSAQSTLAASILKDRSNYAAALSEGNIGDWIKQEVSRINILIDEKHPRELLALLEAFLHLKFRPVYER